MTVMRRFAEKDWVKTAAIIIAMGALIAVAFLPLFFGRFVADDDAAQYALPSFKFYADAVKSGESFYVAPQALSGFPFYLSNIGGFYEPLNYIIFKFLPFPFSFSFRIFLNFWLSAIFVFLVCRAMGLRRSASLVASFAFLIAQDFQRSLNMVYSNSFPFLTGLFYVTLALFNQKTFVSLRVFGLVLLGIVVFTVGMLGGATQLNVQSLVLLCILCLFLWWQKRREGELLSFVKAASLLLIVFAAGLFLFYPHLVRILEIVSYSERSGGLSWELASGATPFSTRILSLVYFFFPKTFHIPPTVEGGGYGMFLGPAALLFFVLFFFSARDWQWRRWLGLFLFSFFSFFPYPLFWLMHQMPIFNLFRNPMAWLLQISFVASVLSGIGYDWFASRARADRVRADRLLFRAAAVLAGCALFAFFTILVFWWRIPDDALQVLNYLTPADMFVPLGIWAALGAWLFLRQKEGRHSAAHGILACAVFASFLVPLWITAFKSATAVNARSIFKEPWVYAEIREKNRGKEPFRVSTFYAGEVQWHFMVKRYNPSAQLLADFQREAVRPNLYHLADDIQTVGGYDNLITRRYKKAHTLLGLFGEEEIHAIRTEDGGTYMDMPPSRFDVLGMMNVKYVWSVLPIYLESLGGKMELISRTRPPQLSLYLYHNKSFIPRVSSPKRIMFLAEDEANFPHIFEQGHNFKEVGFIECADPSALVELQMCAAGAAKDQIPPVIQIKEVHNDSISFSTDGPEDAYVIISNSFIPRWHAYIDGEETKIHYANYIYQGIRVPAGQHEVVMRYEP